MRPDTHIAQVNVARALEPLDSSLLADFVAALAPVNALADAAPGFVWRLQTEAGDATAVRIDDDPRMIVNLSVWASLEALWNFVYGGRHVGVMQRRRSFYGALEAHSVDPNQPRDVLELLLANILEANLDTPVHILLHPS